MKGSILATLATIMLFVGVAAQQKTQTPTPAPTPVASEPFQKVTVKDFAFSVDPFYPCSMSLTKRVTELTASADGPGPVTSVVSFQLFIRVAGQMTAVESFDTADSEITKDAAVGSWFVCSPQVGVAAAP